MFPNLNGQRNLTAGDVSSIRNLYGLRGFDLNEVQQEDERCVERCFNHQVIRLYQAVSMAQRQLFSTAIYLPAPTSLLRHQAPDRLYRTDDLSRAKQWHQLPGTQDHGHGPQWSFTGTRQSASTSGDTLTIRLASVTPDRDYT